MKESRLYFGFIVFQEALSGAEDNGANRADSAAFRLLYLYLLDAIGSQS